MDQLKSERVYSQKTYFKNKKQSDISTLVNSIRSPKNSISFNQDISAVFAKKTQRTSPRFNEALDYLGLRQNNFNSLNFTSQYQDNTRKKVRQVAPTLQTTRLGLKRNIYSNSGTLSGVARQLNTIVHKHQRDEVVNHFNRKTIIPCQSNQPDQLNSDLEAAIISVKSLNDQIQAIEDTALNVNSEEEVKLPVKMNQK